MRGEAMERLCNKLQLRNIDLKTFDGLEFFAREGDWQTTKYASRIKSLEAWEIDVRFEKTLRQNLPEATITIGDSFTLAKQKINNNSFDFIVIDNPQNTFGDNNQYCEHFDVLPLVKNLMKDAGVIIYNVNTNPFNYGDFPLWEKRRKQFYQMDETQLLTDEFLYDFYREFWVEQGFEVELLFREPRNDEYLSYIVSFLKKVD